jgi:hypothetical protein
MTPDPWPRPLARGEIPGVEHNGIIFCEVNVSAPVVRRISVEISRQNSNLSAVKTKMAAEAAHAGANAIVNFRYGQRAHPWWKQFLSFKWDSESWFGDGDAIHI